MTEQGSGAVLRGEPPKEKPPRVADFDELDKKSIDNLVDYMKYVATASGVTMGFYAKTIQDNASSLQDSRSKLIVFLPVIFWFGTIVFSVIGVFPRTYRATNDYEKELAIEKIRTLKTRYCFASIVCFLVGFLAFSYVEASTLWKFFPF